MKKTMTILFAALLIFSCGDGNREFSPPIALTLTVRDDVAPLSAGLKQFARLAAERSHHTLLVTVIYTKAPGDERAVLKTIRDGGLDLACVGTQALSALNPEYGALTLPFLFKDDEHFRRLTDGPVGRALLESLGKNGLSGIGFFDQGGLRLMSRDTRLLVPADFGKKRFRIPVNPALRRSIERWGGFVIPVPEEQAADALKLGLVDAAADFAWAFEAHGFTIVAKRISLVDCAHSPFVLVMSRAAAQRLPAAAVDFLRRAASDASSKTSGESEAIADLAGKGLSIDKPDRAAFAAGVEAVYREQPELVRLMATKIIESR